MRKINLFIFLLLFLVITGSSCKKNVTLFSTGFVEENEKGLAVYDFNQRNGSLELITEAELGPMASYLCFSDKHSLIYTINEVFEFRGEFGGGLSTFSFDRETYKTEKQNELLIPYAGPCYISLNYDSTYLFIASYPNGSVAAVSLDEKGIPISVTDTILFNKDEPDESHAHMIIHDPAGRFIYVTDLGMNRIYTFTFDKATGKFQPVEGGLVQLPHKTGPRHFTFNADGSKFYMINENGCTIMVFNVKTDGKLEQLQTVPTLDPGFMNLNACADIHLGKDGKNLYGTNR